MSVLYNIFVLEGLRIQHIINSTEQIKKTTSSSRYVHKMIKYKKWKIQMSRISSYLISYIFILEIQRIDINRSTDIHIKIFMDTEFIMFETFYYFFR